MSTVADVRRIHVLPRSELATDIDAFLVDREARGLSPRTVSWYAEKLGILRAYLADNGVTEVLSITPDLLRRFLLHLAESHNAGGVHGCYRAMRAFLRWYANENEPQGWVNPIAKVPGPRVPNEVLAPVDLNDLRKMIDTCKRRTFTGDRDRALFLFLLDSGCRRGEVASLNIADVNLATGSVLIQHGKGNKGRLAFIGARTRKALIAYLRHRPNAGPNDPLWCTKGETRLSYDAYDGILRRRAAMAHVKAPSMHSFRRGFALAALRGGVDLLSVSKLLGHTSLAVVSRYLKQATDDLQQAHAKADVVGKLLG